MSNILIHCDNPAHQKTKRERMDWKFGNFTRTPDGWRFIATGKHPNRGTYINEGIKKYDIRCKQCGLSASFRADRLHPILDTLADTGVTTLTLQSMSGLGRFMT